MHILFCTLPYRPSVGGIETVSALLAAEFHRQGHQVTMVTQTPAGTGENEAGPEPWRIVRRPDAATLWRLVGDCDLVFHNNISLRLAWPLLLRRRPWVVAHHTWIPHQGTGRLKRWALRFAASISISQPMARDLGRASDLVPNPYQAPLFRPLPEVPRDRELLFLGRLVSDKGVQVLVDALALLAAEGRRPGLTIIGDGPERPALAAQIEAAGLTGQVTFAGRLGGEPLVRELNRHRVLVVPSLWEEPFGLVALEGLACGCVPVVADSGGLPEAVGPCGHVVPKGNPAALAATLARVLATPADPAGLAAQARAHLQRHQPDQVAAAYLAVLERQLATG